MRHCLLTVLFLLDFIKTPSAISSGTVEEVVKEEMEEEKSERIGYKMAGEWLDSCGECRLLRWSLIGGTVQETEERLNQVFGGNKGQLEQEKYEMSVSPRRQDSCFLRKLCISSQYQ